MAMMLRTRGSGLRLGCTAWAGMRGIADVLGFGEAWEKAGGFRMLRARGNHVNCMLMSSSGGRNIEAFQRNTLKPLGEIMRARSSGIKPNRLSVALFAALALPVAGTAFAQDRSEEHKSELQSLMRNSYAVYCLKKKHKNIQNKQPQHTDSQ